MADDKKTKVNEVKAMILDRLDAIDIMRREVVALRKKLKKVEN